MALFLITSLIDEGMYDNDYRVVEAGSREEVAQHMIDHPNQWESYLRSASLLRHVEEPDMNAKRFLELVKQTCVDGDSAAQLRIFEIQIEKLPEVDTDPFRHLLQTRQGWDDHFQQMAAAGEDQVLDDAPSLTEWDSQELVW